MLNFKDFQKVAEDKKSATMKHKDGHTIVIAVKALPKIQQEALKRLPLCEGGEAKLKARAHYDEGTPDQPVSSDDASSNQDQKPPVTVNVNQAPQTSPAAQQASTPVNVPQPNVQTANPPVLLPNGSMSAPGAAQTGQESIQGQEKIDASRAQAMVPVEQARLRAHQLNAQQDQDNINALRTHADNLAANIKDIDPDAYRKNMSAPDKVATGIGLFLGGFSTPFGGHNFAQDFLNKQIDRDIQGQIANQDKQKTIWGAYNSLYGNQNVASNMTKGSMAQAYADQVDQIAAKLGTPQAIVNAQKLKAGLAATANKAILDSAGNLRSTPNNPQNMPTSGSGVQPSGVQNVSAPGDNKEKDNTASPLRVLTPGAEDQVSQLLKYDHTLPDEEKRKISDQMTGAAQADKQLQRLDNEQTFEKLVAVTRNGGPGARALRNLSPHAIGAAGAGLGAGAGAILGKGLKGTGEGATIGGILGEGLGHMVPSLEINRHYDTLKQQLAGTISAALGNRGDQFVQEAIDKFTPEYGDSDQLLKDKQKGLKEYIIDHTPSDALFRHQLSYK